LYTIRSVAIIMLTYFIFSYHIRSISFIRLIIKIWLALSMFAALMAFKQQYIGFFAYEEEYLYSDPGIAGLLFIGGEWRKFSIFSDPVAFSYNMVVSSLLCVGLMYGPISKLKKWILGGMIPIYLISMLFSGTRGAFVLFPVSMILLAILTFNRKTLIVTFLAGLFVGFLIVVPTSNLTLYRFQTAFKPSDDASFNVRANNQKLIQPFIQSHPMGGGLGSTGLWGLKFSPGSFLANFPPDSGYVRVAVELGWVGLLLFCTLIFIILKTGIENYYRIRDPELKSYCLAMILIVFAYNIGNYPQEALVQFPSNVYFYLVAALINITYKLDQEKQNEHLNLENDLTNRKLNYVF
jgi:putative inorganic carbon (HCO3(-)) transporter